MNILVLVDTLNFFHRAFHAYPPQLTTPQGEPINAVYGFATMLLALVQELGPTHLAVAYESEKEPTFRELEFPAYKATRVPLPPEEQVMFDSQLPRLEEFVKAAKITVLRAEGFEADDVIGTVSRLVTSHKLPATEAIIASNDRDLMQLIGPRVRFYLPAVGSKQKAKLYTERDFFEEYGFRPPALVDYKALRGDPSDNIPGVRGIGEKTAAELIKKYGAVTEIYKHILEIRPAIAQKLADGKKDAVLSRKIATIVADAPVKINLEELKFGGFDQPEVCALFEKWGFKSLLRKLGKASDDRRQDSGGSNQLKLV
uniref:5'-3' exonuclease domain-containing protein n=1 Tax=candidate division WWE3 bacterium TaxID=2053526 RepID=A0A831Z0S1_UNCKA